tara:strand:+ start:73 stop:585 length:513 start_codon:yes stop_codon:yes gene_type:complete
MALSKGSSLSAGESGGGGAMEFISTTNVAGANIIDIQSGFTSAYDNYVVVAAGISVSNNDDSIYMKVYKNETLLSSGYQYYRESGSLSSNQQKFLRMCYVAGADSGWTVNLTNANSRFFSITSNGYYRGLNLGFNDEATSGVITGIQFFCQTGSVSFTAGTVKLYGIKKQ